MTTGTVAHFDASSGTGMLECCSGTLFPFKFRGDELAVGDRVSFLPTGGILGLYAINVQRVEQAVAPSPVPARWTPRANPERPPLGSMPQGAVRQAAESVR